jgi:biotin carboxyl carrier protein
VTHVLAEVTGNVWKVSVEQGQDVAEGAEVVILESMKMEIPVFAPATGVISELRVQEGGNVKQGEIIAVMHP